MKIIFKYVFKNIFEKPGRSLLIIFSLMIASLVLILNLTIPNQIINENKNKVRSLVGQSDIIALKFDYFSIDELKKTNDDIKYVGVNQTNVIHKDKSLSIYGLDIHLASSLDLVSDIKLEDNEIIINKSTAKKYNYQVNDILKLEYENKIYDLKIKAILEDKGLLYFKAYSAVLNNESYNKIFGSTNLKYMTYYIDVLDNTKISEYTNYLSNHNKGYIFQKTVNDEKITDDNAYITMILLIIFVMAVIMIFFVINTLNKMIIMERTPRIATFRSIGATKMMMNAILVLENAMYGLIGGALGSLSSLLISNYCVKILLGGNGINTKVRVQNLIIGILFAILLEIFMSIGAIIKSNKYSIKELMFEKLSTGYVISKKEIILSCASILLAIFLYLFISDEYIIIDLLQIILFWVGVANIIPILWRLISKVISVIGKKTNNGSLIIASKNIGYNKMIISSSRLVVIAISVMLVILNLSATFDNMLDSFSYQFRGYDIFIRETKALDSEYEKLIDLDGVKDVGIVYMATSDNVKNYDKKLNIAPIILGMKDSRPDITELDYKIKDLKYDEILVDKVYLENNKWQINDKIKLQMNGYEGEHEFKIVGTVDSFYFSIQREIIVVNEQYFKDNITRIPFQITLALDNKDDVDGMIEKLEMTLKDPDIVIMTVDGFVADQRANIHTIMNLFYIIISLALVLSFVGIINNQVISFIERTKELAVLNSVCMSKGQLKRMLVLENIVANVIAGFVGFVVSIVSVKFINSVLNGIRLYINVLYDYYIGLIFIGILLLIVFMIVVIPIKKLNKINIVETIKYE